MNRVWLYSVLVAFAYGMLTLSFLCLCRCQSHFVLKLSGCLWSYTYSVLTITAYGNFAKRTMYVRFWGEGHNEAKYGQKHLRNFEGYVFTRHGHRQPFWQRHKVRQFAISGIYLLYYCSYWELIQWFICVCLLLLLWLITQFLTASHSQASLCISEWVAEVGTRVVLRL